MENIILGFLTGGSLILAIGPQNIFVIEQGLKKTLFSWLQVYVLVGYLINFYWSFYLSYFRFYIL